ncbi:hypothetical protein ABIB14_001947 [Arthrobacter sp. UYEF3]
MLPWDVGLPLQQGPDGPHRQGRDGTTARAGRLDCAAPVLAPAARVPLAGLLLAFPALQSRGLHSCAKKIFGVLPQGLYDLEIMLSEYAVRALAGEARAEGPPGSIRLPRGRVLGLVRAPVVKTIRCKLGILAGSGQGTG